MEYSDLLHLSITSNGLSIEEERIKNLLGVLRYQLESIFDSRTVSAGGGGVGVGVCVFKVVTYEVHTRHSSTF